MGQWPPVTHIIEPYHHSLSWNYFHPAWPEVLGGWRGRRWVLRSQRPLEADSGGEGRKLRPSSTSRSLENPCPGRGSWNISQPKVTGCWAADIPRLKVSLGPSACLSCNRAKSQWGGGSSTGSRAHPAGLALLKGHPEDVGRQGSLCLHFSPGCPWSGDRKSVV